MVQLSLNSLKPMSYHVELGAKLDALRRRGVLVVSSGNVVHNLRVIDWHNREGGEDWAHRFDDAAADLMSNRPEDIASLTEHPDVSMAVPTPDHFLPLLYTAGIAAASPGKAKPILRGYGLVVPQGIAYIAQRVPPLIEDAENELPGNFRLLIQRLLDHLKALQEQVDEIEVQIKAWQRASEASQRLEKVPGIGPLTASALVASIGDAKNFDSGRQFAAWLGVVPRQHSSGGKPTLLGMSKRGDAYLRTMLIHGARSVIYRATQKADPDSWLVKITTRRNKNVAAVAMANKTARTVWALLAHGREFKAGYAAA